ncbi:MAG: YlxR family protein, partial [Chloroflexi bacterium]
MSKIKKQARNKHIPQRLCIACRQKRDKRQLTRLVRTENGVIVDPTGKQNGRGAYVCDQPQCWDKIVKSRLLDKALKTEISADEKS